MQADKITDEKNGSVSIYKAEPKLISINGEKITDKNIMNAVENLKRNITRKTKSEFLHGKEWYLKKKAQTSQASLHIHSP